jgi:hypothetical protein
MVVTKNLPLKAQAVSRSELALLKNSLISLASTGAYHAYAGSLQGFYIFVYAQSACISHPEWDSRDAENLAKFLRERKINLLMDTFGHYESLWDIKSTIRISCLYASLETIVGNLEYLAEYLQDYRTLKAQKGGEIFDSIPNNSEKIGTAPL